MYPKANVPGMDKCKCFIQAIDGDDRQNRAKELSVNKVSP